MNVIGFDFDGTLVKSWTGEPLPGVKERLHALPEGTRTYIATNQAGPVWRKMTSDAKYPTCEDVAQRIIAGLAALDWRPEALFIATNAGNEPDYSWRLAAIEAIDELYDCLQHVCYTSLSAILSDRKPRPGMLLDAAEYFCVATSLYIGDMETDHQAAGRDGCRYQDAARWREEG